MTELPPPDSQYLSYASPENRPGNGLAIGSMVCGICSIPLTLCAWYIGIPTAIVAVVLGFVARSKARRGQAQGRSMALAGIICGSALLLALIMIGGIIAFLYAIRRNPALFSTTAPTTSTTVVVKSTIGPTPPAPTAKPTTR